MADHVMAHATAEESAAKRRKLGDECAGASAPTNVNAPAACLRMREKILAVERDYTHYFALDVGGEAGADQYVYQHFNTLCMVGIAPSSLAFSGGRKVTQVDFAVGRGGADKTGNKFSEVLYVAKKPSGKKKHGASFLNESSRLCDLVCDDGTRIKVRCAIQGHLLELNTRLQENPDLLNSKVREHCNLLDLDQYRATRAGSTGIGTQEAEARVQKEPEEAAAGVDVKAEAMIEPDS